MFRIASLIILFLKLEDVASYVPCGYFPYYPSINVSINEYCFSHCCDVSFPTTRESACCGEWKFDLIICLGVPAGICFLLFLVATIFCLIDKCKKTKTQTCSLTSGEITFGIASTVPQAPVISYSTARNFTSLDISPTQKPYPFPFPSADFDSDSDDFTPGPYPYLPYVLSKPLPHLSNLPTSANSNAQKKDEDPPNYVSTMKIDLQKEP